MIWERGARAFWPLLALLAVLFAVLALGGVESLPTIALPWLGGAAMAALIVAAIVGGLRYRRVRESEALERLDRTLPGRPLAALGDHAVLGGEGALWRAHLVQMQARAEAAPGVRMLGGRLFQEKDGVWTEPASSDLLPLVTVKLFSRAWFDLLAALPELAPAARELGRLEAAGARLRLRVDTEGLDQLPADRLARLVRDFRGMP